MGLLVSGLVIFFGVHLFTEARQARAKLIGRIGERPYKGLYALVSLAGFVLIVVGMGRTGTVALWTPPDWGRTVAIWLMPLAFVLLAAFLVPGNLRRLTAHPMLWGVTLWALAHLLANGDLAGVLLFASFGAYSLFSMRSQTARGARPSTRKRPYAYDAATVALGLLLYWGFFAWHGTLFGVAATAG